MNANTPPADPRTCDDDTGGVLRVVRLLQLASPALPVGAYSYSQGLEWAIERRIVGDPATAAQWIGDTLDHVLAGGEAAVAWRLMTARASGDRARFIEWNAWYRASRESSELRAETEQMGASLLRLARELDVLDADAVAWVDGSQPLAMAAAFALAACALGIRPQDALAGYLMSWLENQVLVAVKTIPLGQSAGQRLLLALGARIPDAVARARSIADDDIASFAPGIALASCHHETQYSRLFRS